ncbi:MAG: membrane dipeptidase [Firmicutes bacterium HGW-Firmicutes-16]|nr:MAG: membrane dipeptidase [Firmicutes bacterium HGW-Firmicutes-16]
MNIPVFDAHCDTILEAKAHGCGLRRNSLHVDLERGGLFAPYAQIFAIFTRPWPENVDWKNIDYSKDWPAEVLVPRCDELLKYMLSEFDKNADILTHCKSSDDAETAAKDGKVAAFIAIEGAELVGCDLKRLEAACGRGVRFINLCWNFDNALCGAANGPTKSGLTRQGADYVKRMQELGVAVDLSHASERTFWDVAEITKRPIIAGHSNSKAVCDNARNLTDEQFKALVSLHGVAGINLCPDFLNESSDAGINDIMRHIEHFLALGGEKAVCLGGDLDGIDCPPKGVAGIEDYGKIYNAMLGRNYSEDLVRDIFYNNLFDVLERVL